MPKQSKPNSKRRMSVRRRTHERLKLHSESLAPKGDKQMIMKTVLVPNAPWPKVIIDAQSKAKAAPKKRVKPSEVDAKDVLAGMTSGVQNSDFVKDLRYEYKSKIDALKAQNADLQRYKLFYEMNKEMRGVK